MKRGQFFQGLVGLGLAVGLLIAGFAVWSPGQAQMGVQAHRADETPNAVPRTRSENEGIPLPTSVPPGQPPPGSERNLSGITPATPTDPIERIMRERQRERDTAVAALPAPAATAHAEQIERSKREAGLRLTPSPGPSPTRHRGPSPVQQVQAGAGVIIDDRMSPLRPQSFAGRNQWEKEFAPGRYLTVWAGAQGGGGVTGDSRQGMLFVGIHGDTWSDLEQTGFYPTPQLAGAVRVVGASGDRLTLLSDDGVTFIFDASSRTFLSPTGQPIPPGATATPVTGTQPQ